jgi:hypothetical protein
MSGRIRRTPAGRYGARSGRTYLLVLAVTVLQGCGVPTGSTVHDIDPVDVPSAFTTHKGPDPGPPATGAPAVYFADTRGRLVPSPVRVAPTSTASALQAVLVQLTAGPSTMQTGRGLATELPPTIALRVVSVTNHQATLALSGDRLPPTDQTTAIAQIVLSATSVTGVGSVRLTLNDRPLEAPLADGALTTRPLTATDYETLLHPRPTT